MLEARVRAAATATTTTDLPGDPRNGEGLGERKLASMMGRETDTTGASSATVGLSTLSGRPRASAA
jgi:hypothetical protein